MPVCTCMCKLSSNFAHAALAIILHVVLRGVIMVVASCAIELNLLEKVN